MEYVYATSMHPIVRGRRFSNASLFTAPMGDATKVFVVGQWPKIVQAYEALEVDVVVLTPKQANEMGEVAPVAKAVVDDQPVTIVDPKPVEIPADLAALSWKQLRKMAGEVSSTKVVNKKQAIAVITAARHADEA